MANLPTELPDGKPAGSFAQAKPGHLLSVLPGVGAFSARDGTLIEFAHADDADQGALALHLGGTARGGADPSARRIAVACRDPGAAGRRDGAGDLRRVGRRQSQTLAAELCRRGWALVADDTTRVTWDGTHPVAWPSRDTIKLWKDACDAAGLDIADLRRVMNGLDKFYVRVAARDKPVRLGTIVELSPSGGADSLSAGDKMALVSRNTYRPAQIFPWESTAACAHRGADRRRLAPCSGSPAIKP
ncbi:MAG: hypothetical protein WDN08_07795 [Rhizomicrobium sp.]